jgi:hypothetical protein
MDEIYNKMKERLRNNNSKVTISNCKSLGAIASAVDKEADI